MKLDLSTYALSTYNLIALMGPVKLADLIGAMDRAGYPINEAEMGMCLLTLGTRGYIVSNRLEGTYSTRDPQKRIVRSRDRTDGWRGWKVDGHLLDEVIRELQ